MTAVLVASDLDRTLIYSARALLLEAADADAPRLVVSEVYQGAPLSFMTRRAEDALSRIASRAAFVPVTTRTVAQYRRVRLPGGVPEHAVTSNGGTILHRGEIDEGWNRSLRRRTAETCAPLVDVQALLTDPSRSSWVLRVHDAESLFLYAIVDRDILPADDLAALSERCVELGWVVSVQGRKLYCVPTTIDKRSAVAEIASRTGADTVLALGDSLLDEGMLTGADLAFRPAHGELHDVGFTASHLTVTSSRGVLAGEEMLLGIEDVIAGG
ncbi:HAD family hydrolase [Frondihabitans peucedani]|uniref:Hydroxymethylpyrimidine pyrophosphatase-like HAD family hydrolase n=1 Tax=Frondihabitans peucedani TaxID=598626 RepID=A0ABP8DXP3_9MICO